MRLILLLPLTLLPGCISVYKERAAFNRLKKRVPAPLLDAEKLNWTGEVQVPLERFLGLTAVRAEIDSHPLTLLLDTGSPSCLLRAGLAEKLQLNVCGKKHYSLLGHEEETAVVQAGEVRIGPMICRNLRFVVTPGSIRRYFLGFTVKKVDGVLGAGFLNQFRLTIDRTKQKLRFSPAGSYAPPEGSRIHTLPLEFLKDGRPYIRLSFPQKKGYPFLLDIGADSCVLQKDLAESLGLPSLGKQPLIGLGIKTEAEITEIPVLSLNGMEFKRVPAYFVPQQVIKPQTGLRGIAGLGLFEGFSVTLAPEKKLLVLEENARQ